MVGVDHELGGDVREVGDVAFEAGKGACLGFQGPVDTLGGAGELDEPVAFDRGLAGDGLLGLGDLFVDAVQGAPSPVRPVLVVDDLVAALVLGPAGQGWVKMCQSGICSSGCSWRHAWTTYGTSGIRAPRMNDNPAASMACWLAAEIMPASATTVTSASWWASMNARMVGSIVVVSPRLPSNALTINGNPLASVSSPIVLYGSRRRSFGEPGLTEPVPGIGLEVQGGHIVENQ